MENVVRLQSDAAEYMKCNQNNSQGYTGCCWTFTVLHRMLLNIWSEIRIFLCATQDAAEHMWIIGCSEKNPHLFYPQLQSWVTAIADILNYSSYDFSPELDYLHGCADIALHITSVAVVLNICSIWIVHSTSFSRLRYDPRPTPLDVSTCAVRASK